MTVRAALAKTFSVYALLSLVVGAQAAILVFVRGFGNSKADVIAGSILGFVALVAFVGHTLLANWTITVPGSVVGVLTWVNGVAVALVAAGGMIVQYVGTVSPTLTPWVAVALQGAALVGSLIAGLFTASVARRVAPRGLPFDARAAR
jgi:hypothetical protein